MMSKDMNNVIKELTDSDDEKAYARAKEIAAASELSSEYYSYLEAFAPLLTDKKILCPYPCVCPLRQPSQMGRPGKTQRAASCDAYVVP